MTPTIRFATADDAPLIHRFIVDLATYERERDAVQVTVDTLRTQLASDKPPFECLIAHAGDEPVGFALFFTSAPACTLKTCSCPNPGAGAASD